MPPGAGKGNGVVFESAPSQPRLRLLMPIHHHRAHGAISSPSRARPPRLHDAFLFFFCLGFGSKIAQRPHVHIFHVHFPDGRKKTKKPARPLHQESRRRTLLRGPSIETDKRRPRRQPAPSNFRRPTPMFICKSQKPVILSSAHVAETPALPLLLSRSNQFSSSALAKRSSRLLLPARI